MIPETSVDWKAFEYKYSDNPQRAFENLTYYLFCHEFNQKMEFFGILINRILRQIQLHKVINKSLFRRNIIMIPFLCQTRKLS